MALPPGSAQPPSWHVNRAAQAATAAAPASHITWPTPASALLHLWSVSTSISMHARMASPARDACLWHASSRLALPRIAASNRAPHRIAAQRTTHVFDMWHPSGVSCALSLSYETNFRYQVVALSISISTLLPHGNDSSSACDYLKLCFNFKRPPFFFFG